MTKIQNLLEGKIVWEVVKITNFNLKLLCPAVLRISAQNVRLS